MDRSQLVQKLISMIQRDVSVGPEVSKALGQADAVHEEFQSLSVGTALAAALRPAGLVFSPVRSPDKISLQVVSGKKAEQLWPIGWDVKSKSKAAPQMFEFLNAEIEPVPVNRALNIIIPNLEMKALYDWNSIVAHQVDFQTKVSYPKKRSTYSLILKNLLYQAKLKYEIRVDENDQAFLWITSYKAK